jgi:hypothetical protein
MVARGPLASFATLSLIVCAVGGCAAGADDDRQAPPEPEKEEPLDLTVDALEVVHGSLRVSATMADGAADVSVRLGGTCEHSDVGGGVSTRSTLVWALGDRDVAAAIGCGLVFRARVRDGARYVSRVAEVALAVDVAAGESGDTEGPQLQTVGVSDTGVALAFGSVTRSALLVTAASVLEAAPPEPDDEGSRGGDGPRRFVVPCIDFARTVLLGRSLELEGASFEPTLSVGGASIEGEVEFAD